MITTQIDNQNLQIDNQNLQIDNLQIDNHQINFISYFQIDNLSGVENVMGEYWNYIMDFIEDMKKVFPTLKDDWGIYVPEVKYLSPEPLVNYRNLSLTKFPNVHFVGDALSARGITVSGAQAIYVAEDVLSYYLRDTEYPEFISHYVA